MTPRVSPMEGRIAIVTDAGRDAVDAEAAKDARGGCVRRSRVDLTPRCWRQVGGRYLANDGGKKAGRRGERVISRKAIARGRPECSDCTCMLVCALLCAHCARDRGCSVHPVFPASSFEGGSKRSVKPRAHGAARRRIHIWTSLRGAKRRSNPFFRCAARWIASLRSQ
jgi:hypothetical protein